MKKSNDILIPEIERLLKDKHLVEFIPRGISMRPFIEGGHDKVILRACEEPQVGQIVLARVQKKYVLHRIYKLQGEQIILRGDGNLTGSEVCCETDIIGQVVRIKTHDGKNKRLTTARLWRHLPKFLRKLYLKLYRIIVILRSDYED